MSAVLNRITHLMSTSDRPFIAAADLNREGWLALSAAVAAFERANRQSPAADPAEFLMDGPPEIRQRTLIELLKVDLEHRWERREQARIEEYFERWPKLARLPDARRELLEAECVTRCGFGRVVTAGELEERFPELAWSIDLEAIHREVAAEGWSAILAETMVPGSDTPGVDSGDETPVLEPGTRISPHSRYSPALSVAAC